MHVIEIDYNTSNNTNLDALKSALVHLALVALIFILRKLATLHLLVGSF